jgi:hypothetical protein
MSHLAWQRGVTVFEAKLVAGALALTLTGAVFAYGHAEADDRARTSQESATRILKAAQRHFDEQNEGCPTVTTLGRDQYLPPDAPTSDAWGERFRVSCEQAGPRVYSAGEDGQFGTDDDVSVGSPAHR